MNDTTKTTLSVVVLMLVLAGAGILATVASLLSGEQVYGLLMAVAGTTILAGGLALSGPTTSTTFVPHLMLVASAVGLTIAMGLEHVFSASQVTGVFYLVIGPGLAVTGGHLYAARLRRIAAAFDPPGVLHEPTPAPADPPAAPVADAATGHWPTS